MAYTSVLPLSLSMDGADGDTHTLGRTKYTRRGTDPIDHSLSDQSDTQLRTDTK